MFKPSDPRWVFDLEKDALLEVSPQPRLWTKEQWESLRERPSQPITRSHSRPDYSQYPTPQQRLEWLEQLPHFDFLLLADSEFCSLAVQLREVIPIPPRHVGEVQAHLHEAIDQLEQLYKSAFPDPF